MSRFNNEITHLQAHIKTLRLGAGALVLPCLRLIGAAFRAWDNGLRLAFGARLGRLRYAVALAFAC